MKTIPALSQGALADLVTGGSLDPANPVVVQILGNKRLINQQQERYRLLISDGRYSYQFAMLSTQLNHLVTDGQLETFAVIKIKNLVCNTVPAPGGKDTKKLMILLDLEIVKRGSEVGEKIGEPVALGELSDAQSKGSAVAPVPARSEPVAAARHEPPQPSRPSHTASNSSRNVSMDTPVVHPIQSLTPYQNRWTIKARVTKKSDIRTWSNSRGEGKLFSVDLMDESGEIKATAFNQDADKFYDVLEEGKVYYITGAMLKPARKEYTSIVNDYEMSFSSRTQITPCFEDTSDVPNISFNFVPISKINEVEKDSFIDVIGVVKSTSDLATIVSRNNNKEYKKREVSIMDQSKTEVSLTLWGKEAEDFDGSTNPVLAMKGVKVSDFGGKSLSAASSTRMTMNPDISEAHRLRGWYDNEGCNVHTQSISAGRGAGAGPASAWKCFAEAKAEGLGGGEKPDYYTVKAMVAMVQKERALYMACPQPDCNKKVVDQNNGLYRCEKCNREFDNFKWRLMLSVNVTDFSDHQWVTLFQDNAEILLGRSADELGNMKDSDPMAFQKAFESVHFKWFVFRVRVKMETYNDENRLKTFVVEVKDLDFIDYNQRLIQKLRELEL